MSAFYKIQKQKFQILHTKLKKQAVLYCFYLLATSLQNGKR